MPAVTSQTGSKQYNGRGITNYSGFVGGVNASNHALKKLSPAQSGYVRLFMVRPPLQVLQYFAENKNMYSADSLFIQVKHMMEYYYRSIDGFSDLQLDVADTPVTGGFTRRSYNTPTVASDTMTQFTINMFEPGGHPVHSVIEYWMNSIGDINSGLAHYGGAVSIGKGNSGLETRLYDTRDGINTAHEYNEANHSAEFIMVAHDKSGAQVEQAVFLADCFPISINRGAIMNFQSGTHDNVTYDITFNCVPYRGSPIINSIANDLLKKYMIVSNMLNYNPELGDAVYALNQLGVIDEAKLGQVPWDTALGTNIGNAPAYTQTITAQSRGYTDMKNIEEAKLAGQGLA